MSKLIHWSETPAWLRALKIDADVYQDANLARIVRMAREGCPVSLANARRAHERVMGRS
jgi:hypothetical protein